MNTGHSEDFDINQIHVRDWPFPDPDGGTVPLAPFTYPLAPFTYTTATLPAVEPEDKSTKTLVGVACLALGFAAGLLLGRYKGSR